MFRNTSNNQQQQQNPTTPPWEANPPTTGSSTPNPAVDMVPANPSGLNLAGAKKAADVAGQNPERKTIFNLRDHPEFDGVSLAIVKVSLQEGDFGSYVLIAGYPIDDNGNPMAPVVISTGSQNVVERALAIAGSVSMSTPVIGTLRAGGRAWFLD